VGTDDSLHRIVQVAATALHDSDFPFRSSWGRIGTSSAADYIAGASLSGRLYRASLAGLTLLPLWLGRCALEAPGRGLLLYAKYEQHGIYARSLAGVATKNPETRLIEDYVPAVGGLAPMDDGVYCVGSAPAGQPRAFRFYSFASGQAVDIAPTPPNYAGDISVAPDRRRLAYSTEAKGSQDLVQLDLK
jgi:hypothetical protein